MTPQMAEVLLDIAQNASIRGMRVDGVDLFSVLDFLKYVCHDHSNVRMMWQRLENQMSAEVVTRSYHLKFKGKPLPARATARAWPAMARRHGLRTLGSAARAETSETSKSKQANAAAVSQTCSAGV